MQMVGGTRLDVVPAALGRWDVREPGSRHALDSASSEAEALRRARRMMKRRGGEIRLYDGAGGVVITDSVIGLDRFPRPWWAVSTSPWSIVRGAVFFSPASLGCWPGRRLGGAGCRSSWASCTWHVSTSAGAGSITRSTARLNPTSIRVAVACGTSSAHCSLDGRLSKPTTHIGRADASSPSGKGSVAHQRPDPRKPELAGKQVLRKGLSPLVLVLLFRRRGWL